MNGHTNWRIVIRRKPLRVLSRLPVPLRRRLSDAINTLSQNPFPPNSTRLSEFEDTYRLRVGSWRIIYALENEQLIVLVTRISARGDAYKDL